ncbi:hypothetical protein FUA23_16485 [Neolewinella aurantiaca]|uniref:Uncharacterized protein n=1 Tax=Neolewinella aurantiaca TaxID=2602767 RepID=A0A5C7FQ36_9BACT|nr:hypothetical protein [Neolewinella aurantiaca]TXF88077.1 hypothetical protein FUA23_16485 [Neolewinella aurantiaca]
MSKDKKPPKNYSISEFQEKQEKKLEELRKELRKENEEERRKRDVEKRELEAWQMKMMAWTQQTIASYTQHMYQQIHQMRENIIGIQQSVLDVRNTVQEQMYGVQNQMMLLKSSVMELDYQQQQHALDVSRELQEYAGLIDSFQRDVTYELKDNYQKMQALESGVRTTLDEYDNRLEGYGNNIQSRFLDFREKILEIDNRVTDGIDQIEDYSSTYALEAQNLKHELRDAYKTFENSKELWASDISGQIKVLDERRHRMNLETIVRSKNTKIGELKQKNGGVSNVRMDKPKKCSGAKSLS